MPLPEPDVLLPVREPLRPDDYHLSSYRAFSLRSGTEALVEPALVCLANPVEGNPHYDQKLKQRQRQD
jgi:hypothetical protein